MTLTKGKETGAGKTVAYLLTGTAEGKWNGKATIELLATTSEVPNQSEKTELTIKRNDKQKFSNSVVSFPIQKCEVKKVTYTGSMLADDFVSIDNVANGAVLTVGPSLIAGTVKEDDCKVSFGGQEVPIGADQKFTVTSNINEGTNTLSFTVTEKTGSKTTKTVSITGQIPPEVYKASCPPGPGYAVLNKDPQRLQGNTRSLHWTGVSGSSGWWRNYSPRQHYQHGIRFLDRQHLRGSARKYSCR